jgi:hypothetical protein
VDTAGCGTGETRSRRPPLGGPYKPRAKRDRAGRESEGFIVPWKPVKAGGGKGPCFGRGGEPEVSARAWSQDPTTPLTKVRQLQRRLYTSAKRNRERRFHALYDRIWRSDVLLEALLRCGKYRPRPRCVVGAISSPRFTVTSGSMRNVAAIAARMADRCRCFSKGARRFGNSFRPADTDRVRGNT